MTDLWPDQLDAFNLKAPVAILREQATLLGQKTKNLVQAEVENGTNVNGDFTYHFFIVAPTLNNYHYRLFTIEHKITLYPVQIYLGEDLGQELGASRNPLTEAQLAMKQTLRGMGLWPPSGVPPYYVSAQSEDEFVGVLKVILSSQITLQVISALRSQLIIDAGMAFA